MTPLMSVEDVGRLLSISKWTVRALLKKRKLRPVRIGKRVLIEEAEVQRFIEGSKDQVE